MAREELKPDRQHGPQSSHHQGIAGRERPNPADGEPGDQEDQTTKDDRT
jgi:hypothetical protein